MPIKDCFYRLQPLQLYTIFVLSIFYFIVQLIFSHITHALTLLMASYHMLCNILALFGCIITIKRNENQLSKKESLQFPQVSMVQDPQIQQVDEITSSPASKAEEQSLARRERRKLKLRNTFGWTRINVLTMLIVFIVLASFSFSLLIEALQTLVHIDHQDAMHLPIPVLILSLVGLLLNGLCYVLIGGYSMQQGNFVYMSPEGNVALSQITASNCSQSTLSEKDAIKINDDSTKRQGSVEILRDISSTIFVIVCSIIVYYSEDVHTGKIIDPILAIFSCVLVISLSYPYMKQSCLILLQTIPESMNLESFEKELIRNFPEILNFHDLHIWQLTTEKSVSTVHIQFKSQKLYLKIIQNVKSFFLENGINHITIQPEFPNPSLPASTECLMQCVEKSCATKTCCKQSEPDLTQVITCSHKENKEVDEKADKVASKPTEEIQTSI